MLEQTRHALIDPSAPTAVQAAGGWGPVLVSIGIVAGLLVFGAWLFNREAPRIAEEL